ncbi:hypothetical protein V5799_018501 [Amblyomma americanum]|uniref:FP protein C-terminal domain-containing protein n=1 Tax=Amblyomma americanum TaxID=6943 RepID=A0AAQ4EZC9_AMBAM
MGMKVAHVPNVTLNESDIDIARSVPTKEGNEANMIIRFCSRAKRDAYLGAAKKKTIATTDLGFTGPEENIYVNEHLTPETKRLLGAAVEKNKEVQWKYVWTKNGNVLARKTDVSTVLRIRSRDDISKIPWAVP